MVRTVLGCAAAGLLAAAGARAPSQTQQSSVDELSPPVRLEADGVAIDSAKHNGHSGPLLADLDGDGKAELLVGTFKGFLQLYANTGSATEPRFASRGLLQAGGKDAFVKNW